MAGATVTWIGPVNATLFNMEFEWTGAVDSQGFRQASLSATVERPKAEQIVELTSNPHRTQSVGLARGVLEIFFPEGDFLGPYRGFYLFGTAKLTNRSDTLTDRVRYPKGLVDLSMDMVFLGDLSSRQPVIARSAREKQNDFGLTPKTLVPNPFWGQDEDGQRMLVEPAAATFITREYDPSSYDPRIISASSRRLGIYWDDPEDLPSTLVPVIEQDYRNGSSTTPGWVAYRGHDVRAWDRREEREVYGSHSFRSTTDIVLTNGLFRVWVGNRGLPAFLTTETCVEGVWLSSGVLRLDGLETHTLTGAKLVKVTPEQATLSLELQGAGVVLCTLVRGERGVRITHGSLLTEVSTSRRVAWDIVPPYLELDNEAFDSQVQFQGGLRMDDASLRFVWPPELPTSEWTVAFYWQPNTTTDALELEEWGSSTWGDGVWGGALPDSMIFTLEDSVGNAIGRLTFEAVAQVFTFTLGSQALVTPLQALIVEPVLFIVRFSTTRGLSFWVKAATGPAVHLANAAYTDPGTAELTYSAFGVGSAGGYPFGEGDFGEFPFGLISGGNGSYDTVQIYDGWLTDEEAESLEIRTSRVDELVTPESRLVWQATMDVDSAFSSDIDPGMVLQGLPDEQGLSRVIVSLETSSTSEFGLSQVTSSTEFGAYILLGETGDDPAEVHAQFASVSEQEVRIR